MSVQIYLTFNITEDSKLLKKNKSGKIKFRIDFQSAAFFTESIDSAILCIKSDLKHFPKESELYKICTVEMELATLVGALDLALHGDTYDSISGTVINSFEYNAAPESIII